MKNHTTIDKPNWYRLNCIGKGSFGTVNLAVNESDPGRTFAVKSVNNKSTELLRCLDNEIKILKTLTSPYVIDYLNDDVTSESGSVYRNLHMEYMPGGTIADVAVRKHINDVDVRSYTWCITSALSYIHGRNIIHCDVKGANVLIGDTPATAKLADFGSAMEFGGSPAVTRGSPLWMAPEAVRGEYIGPESDVWSLGCTVIEMITGKPAWQDGGVDTLRRIGYSDEVPEIPSPVPDDLRDFLNKCLKRRRSERWSCDQLLHHPFLLSCTSPHITVYKLSPRCVFDWSDSNSSSLNGYTLDTCQFSKINKYDAKKRIGKLASSSGVVWESEGWEVVRHVTYSTWEYFEGVNLEYTESDQSTSGEAWGTMVDWIYRDGVDVNRCCSYMYVYVWIVHMFGMIVFNFKTIEYIRYTQWLLKCLVFFGFKRKRIYVVQSKHVKFFYRLKFIKLYDEIQVIWQIGQLAMAS
ncbi:mitogen-activated protein kinase kinase kinase 18-like [Bidens hawaiensis]|uniref:mitogen-activated protein kinase kinase kinase 18-like n=1 Tax=Bidens hawaiensis TaxID=980011 RepID=UPI00404B951E